MLDDSGQDPPPSRVELAERVGISEVAQALRLSTVAAGNRVRRGQALAGPLAPAAAALAAGTLTFSHVLVLLDHTDGLDTDLARAMQARALPRAVRQTPGDFGRSLTRARHALDPDGAAAGHRAARAHTGVRKTEGTDGTAALVITATDPDTEWAYTVLDTLARAALHDQHTPDGVPGRHPPSRRQGRPARTASWERHPPSERAVGERAGGSGPAPDSSDGVLGTPPAAGGRPSLDQLRAEVFFRLLDRAVTDPTFPTQHGKRRIETQVVMATPT